jgi:hypothetical protein
MKNLKIYLVATLIGLTALTFTSCKKGEDDPALSLRSRTARFANTWKLTKFEKNGENQSLDGAVYTYDIFKKGTLTQTVEGAVFGFPTKSVKDGTWEFINKKEDVKIVIDGNATTYNIQRLANDELWLKELKDGATYMYYFEGE